MIRMDGNTAFRARSKQFRIELLKDNVITKYDTPYIITGTKLVEGGVTTR